MTNDTIAMQGTNCTDIPEPLVDAFIDWRDQIARQEALSDSQSLETGFQASTPQKFKPTLSDSLSGSHERIGCCIGDEVAEPTDEPCLLERALRQPPEPQWWVEDAMAPPKPHEGAFSWASQLVAAANEKQRRSRDQSKRHAEYRTAASGELTTYELPTTAERAAAEDIASWLSTKIGSLREVFVPYYVSKRWALRSEEPVYRQTTLRIRRSRQAQAVRYVYELIEKHGQALLGSDRMTELENATADLRALNMSHLDDYRDQGQAALERFHRALFAVGCEMAGLRDGAVARHRAGHWVVIHHSFTSHSTPRLKLSPLTRSGVSEDEIRRWMDWARGVQNEFELQKGPEASGPVSDVGPAERTYRVLSSVLKDLQPVGMLTPVPTAHLMLIAPEAWSNSSEGS